MKQEDYTSYGKNYSESGLWDKIKNVAKKAGCKVSMQPCCVTMS